MYRLVVLLVEKPVLFLQFKR